MKKYFEDIGALPHHGNLAATYIGGFVFSIICTLAAYSLIVDHTLSINLTVGIIVLLALVQFAIQLICFLHLGTGRSSRTRLVLFGGAAIVVTILVSGSLWIMFTLNNRMMPSTAQMEQYMDDQGGF